jgi:hypothetical protein
MLNEEPGRSNLIRKEERGKKKMLNVDDDSRAERKVEERNARVYC